MDYSQRAEVYSSRRRADPSIAKQIHSALGDARTVLNVGAGTGSYEPTDRYVIAVEPSASMRAQRPPDAVPAIDAKAESLPLDDGAVDASMASVTVHQWSDFEKGLKEMRRVTRGPVIVLTFDPAALDRFWLSDYVPELISVERTRFPSISVIADALGGAVEVQVVPVPVDCTDGFTEAFYARPEAFLETEVRKAQSAWTFVDEGVERRFVETLAKDLGSGAWDERYGAWRDLPSYEGSLRLLISRPLQA